MKQSQLFTKTRKEAPADEMAKNAILLIRAGYVHKDMAGVYSFLPLGLKVIEKIEKIIRDEMIGLGAQEVSLASLQNKNVWDKTGRWDDAVVDNWFKTKINAGGETALAITHEEPLTQIVSEYVSSHRDLPFSVFQFQTKFRNEIRAKSGIMRGREFIMKDLYSFSKDEAQHAEFYEKAKLAYFRIFERAGLGAHTYITFATGGSFSKFSDEFQAVTDAGEDVIYVDEAKKVAINKEIIEDAVLGPEALARLGVTKESLVEKKSAELGNIFSLGTKFSEPLGLKFKDEEGAKTVIMGSYGIGVPRLMGAIVEILSDEKGIVWPKSVSPFAVHLISLGKEGDEVTAAADELYKTLADNGIESLYDDRMKAGAGEKFADSDLIGIPTRVIVSAKSLEAGGYEIKDRKIGDSKIVPKADIIAALR